METEPSEPESSSAQRPWRRRPVVLALALLLGLELLYLVAANVFLSTGLADRAINRKPEKLLVSYESAWSPWPGELRVRGLSLRGQGRRMQWTATAEEISGRVGLVPLLWKSFRASGVEGEGVLFRLRRRDDRPLPETDSEGGGLLDPSPDPAAGAEPPIPGLENPPEPAPEEVYPPLDPDRRRWTVTLAGFDLERVSEIWIGRVRLRGEMALHDGGMTLKLKRSLRVHPSRFHFDGAHLLLGESEVADQVSGRVLLSSEEFDHGEHRGMDAVPFLVADADLTARLAVLGWLNRFLADDTGGVGLRFGGGAGTLTVDAVLRDARFAPASRLVIETPRFAVGFLDYTARGAGRIAWTTEADDARLAATFARYRLARRGYDAPHVEGSGLSMTLTGLGRELPPSLDEAKVAIEIPPARVPDLAFYDAYLPPDAGLTIRGGTATVRGRFEARPSEGTGSGRIDLSSESVQAAFRGTPLAGALAIEGHFPSADLAARRFRLDGTTVLVTNARRLGIEGGDAEPWSGRVRVAEGTLAPGSSTLLRARAVGAITDVRPVLSLFSAGDRLPGWVLDVLGVDDVQARSGVVVDGGGVALHDLEARADDLTLDGSVRLGSETRRDGRLLLGYKGLHLGLELTGGETDLELLNARRWFERGR